VDSRREGGDDPRQKLLIASNQAKRFWQQAMRFEGKRGGKTKMTSKHVRLWSWFVIVALLFGVVGCGATPAPDPTEKPPSEAPTAAPKAVEPSGEAPAEPVEATETLKLGVLGPFSGPTARTGDEFKGAVQTAFEAIDYQIGPYKVELVWIDSQSDPAKASQAYEQAIVQDKIQAAILNWHSSVVVACMEIAAKHKIPHFFGFGATEVVNETYASDPEKYSYWMGKTWPSPEKLSIAYVQALEYYIQEGIWTPEEKTVVVWGEDTDWGRSFGGAIGRQFTEAGWTVLSEEWFPIDQTEYYGLLNRIKDTNPAVFAGTAAAPPAISSLVKQADEIGLESLLIADALGWVGEWYDLTGASSDYVLDQIPAWATDEAKQWAADFETRFGIKPSPSAAGQSYDMTNFFIKLAQRTLEKHGELTSETLYEVGQSELWTGKLVYEDGLIHTRYEYNEETIPDPVVGEGYFVFPVLQYFDGVGKIIYPPQWAEQELEIKP
jgi:branched-chain amino acid transport system substrate-binding protein